MFRRGRAVLIGVTGTLAALLLPATVSAGAASTGYTASLIRTATQGRWTAVDSATDTVYTGTGTVLTVINGATGSVTTTVRLAGFIAGLAIDATTDKVYVAEVNGGTSGVYVIDGATNTVAATIAAPVGAAASGIAVDSATNTLYVADPGAHELTVIDGATNAITATVSMGSGTYPTSVAVDESSDVVWVADEHGTVIAINGATDTITNVLSLAGGQPVSIAVNEATDTVYAADIRNADVAVIDGKTANLTATVPLGTSPLGGVAVDQSTGVVYATSIFAPFGTTLVIDGSSDSITNTIGRGGRGVAVDQSTGTVYEDAVGTDGLWVITASAGNALSPVITSNAGPGFFVGEASSYSVTASALPAASFSEAGSLPFGVTISANGVVSGTPAAGTGGFYPITITASNGVAPDFTQQFGLIVWQAPEITSGDSATFQVGTAGTFPLTATGYQAPAFASTSTLPAGLSITDQTPGGWQISGTPAVGAGGVYPLTILAYNGVSPEAQQAFTLTVKEAPSFKSSAKATFVTATSGSYQVSANGYPAPTYSETGPLPAGLSLSSAGLLSGTPGTHSGGVYPITITASNGISPSASQSFTLTVDQAPAITSARSATFRVGHHRRFTFRTTGFPAATLSERGRLPAGVRFRVRDNGTAVLAGRTIRADRGKTYVITVIARNGVGAAFRETFRLTVT